MKEKNYRLLFIWALVLWALPVLVHADKKEEFSIVGVWMLKSETAPDGKVTPSIYTQYTRCKIYDADSTYYTVQLHAVGDEMMIIAHEMGRYRLNDSVYMERDRVMPFTVIDDTTFVTEFEGYKEMMVRSTTMTEERQQEIRDLVRKYPDEAEAPVKHFVLSTTERKLKAENQLFLYIIIVLVLAAVGIGVYVYQLRKRKREIERKLAAIEEANALRPEPVATAMKQVETEFFQSEYYLTLRHRIEAGENIKPEEWKELDRQLKVVYPNFSNSLYALYNLSPTEYQVCMLLKIRTKPVEIAAVMNKDKSTISSIRTRLCKKVLGKEGSGKDWDEFILSL
jgi:DNA-binding CsgD family transcriptional regulator/formylmethanofuran dehydrogenase subunit D